MDISEEKWTSLARIAIALASNKDFNERRHLLEAASNVYSGKKISTPYFESILKTLEGQDIIEIGRGEDGWRKKIILKNKKKLKKLVNDSIPVSVKMYLFWIENTRLIYWY